MHNGNHYLGLPKIPRKDTTFFSIKQKKRSKFINLDLRYYHIITLSHKKMC